MTTCARWLVWSARPSPLSPLVQAAAQAPPPPPAPAPQRLDAATAERFAGLALACVHKEYPNKIAHTLNGDADAKPPRVLTPAFYGCYDWHSAVHGHWLLARLTRRFPEAPFAAKARAALEEEPDPRQPRGRGEVPAGGGTGDLRTPLRPRLAAVQLSAELHEWDDPQAKRWAAALRPAGPPRPPARLRTWLPKLSYPIRTGEHNQTAFSLGLIIDWARGAAIGRRPGSSRRRRASSTSRTKSCPLDYEPSGEDFLSPCLAEADLVRRLLKPDHYSSWLSIFLPQARLARSGSRRRCSPDPSDGKLAHLDGLNLSRAWMLEGIASGLPPRIPASTTCAPPSPPTARQASPR